MLSSVSDLTTLVSDIVFSSIYGIPFNLLLVFISSCLLMIRLRFVNLTMLMRSFISILNPQDELDDSVKDSRITQLSSTKAFLAQAAGTLGLGSIAGAGFAIQIGGPGVIFWIIVASFLCSIIKFSEITIGRLYRYIDSSGNVHGGFFYCIRTAFSKHRRFASVIACISAAMTAILLITSSGMQINQISSIISSVPALKSESGHIHFDFLLMTSAVVLPALVVLIGGVKRISNVASILVPFMAISYVIMCILVVLKSRTNIIPSINTILAEAFKMKNSYGGVFIVAVTAIQRMVFASESGVATAAIMHANSNVKYPARQGIVAFFDCFMIALLFACGMFAILVSGADFKSGSIVGVMLLKEAFMTLGVYAGDMLKVIVFLFGVTTIISDGYNFQQASGYLYGVKHVKKYIITYIGIAWILSLYHSNLLILLCDLICFIIIIPHLLVSILLSNVVKKQILLYNNSLVK